MDKKAFVKAQDSSREAPAHFWRKKIQIGHIEEDKKQFHFTRHLSPKVA